MQIKDLKANKRNPRKISEKALSALKKSVDKFGDLSGFIYNVRTKELVGGHQRSKTIPKNSKIVKEVVHENPTARGTVAEGYILVDGERFKYREVDWDEKTAMEALLAANKHSGEWDNDLLKINFADFPELDLEVTGFTMPELDDMGISFELPSVQAPERSETSEPESDEEYLKNHSGPEERADKEIIGEGLYEKPSEEKPEPSEVFDKTDEKKTKLTEKRFVIIIDCDDEDHKKSLKEKLQPIIDEAGAKVF